MLNEKARIFVDTTTPFQRVTIADLPKYGKCLFLDGDLQSAEIDQTTYHSALVEPAFRYNPNVKRALILVAPLLRDWKKISRRNVFLPSFEEKWIFALFAKPQSD